MKKAYLFVGTVAVSLTLFIAACSKKEDSAPATSTTTTSGSTTSGSTTSGSTTGGSTSGNSVSNPSDAYGSLVALQTTTTVVGININLGTATAAFFSSPGSNASLVDGGTVTCNSSSLTKNSNNSYVYTPGTTNPSGITFSGNAVWAVSGSANVPAINYTCTKAVPTGGTTTMPTSITRASGYTFNNTAFANADSVYYLIIDANGKQAIKRKNGSSTSCTFSASDLSGLSAGANAQVQVNGWNYESSLISSKKYYFVNMKAQPGTGVTIQ